MHPTTNVTRTIAVPCCLPRTLHLIPQINDRHKVMQSVYCKSSIHLFRVSHADFKNTYETDVVGMNIQCSLGLVDVFLHETCVGTATYRPPFKECVRRRIDIDAALCIFHCSPIFNSNTTSVRFVKVKHITADYDMW